jgi:tetratricopeptide (TPR) repeat protein
MLRVIAYILCASAVFGQSPVSPQEVLKAAIAAQESGSFDEAIRGYRSILEKYPNIPEIRSNLGAALAGKGQYSEAIVEYRRALKLKPNSQARLNLALAYYKTADLKAAVDTLKAVREEAPSNLQVVTLLADCYLRLGQNKDVIDLLTLVQRADPGNQAFNYLLGTALVRDGQAAKGQLIIDRILSNGDSAEARLLMGTTKYVANDFRGALEDLQKAVELNPGLAEANAYYGMALLASGDQASAKQAFERELKADPNNFDANLRMGVILRQDEENEGATKYLQRALQIRPGDPGVLYQIASVELASGQVDQARRDLEALIKTEPKFLEAHVSLATVYFRQKRKLEGERERAIVAKLNAERQSINEVGAKAP